MANTHSLDLELSSSQYAYVADNVALSITGDISIECLVKLEQLPSSAGSAFAIVSKWQSSSNERSYLLQATTADKIQFLYSGDGTNSTTVTTTNAFFTSNDIGNWIHLAMTADVSAKTVTIYKNGSSQAVDAAVGSQTSIADNGSRFHIGAINSASTATLFFDGKIDEVRVYDDIRTSDEVNNYRFYTDLPTGNNLVGYWKLNNDYTDSSGNSNTLTPSGSPTFSTDYQYLGTPGGSDRNTHSLDLESGSSQYAAITDAAQTGLDITGDISIEAWIKPESTTATQAIVTKYDSSDNTRSYRLIRTSGGAIQAIVSHDGTSTNSIVTQSNLNVTAINGALFHIAYTMDISTNTGTLYINGNTVAQSNTVNGTVSQIYNSDNDFIIGAETSGGGKSDYFDGLVDEVRVYSDVRTQTEIRENMLTNAPTGDNIQGHWRLDNDYTDQSGNSNTLTASGSPVFSTIRQIFYSGLNSANGLLNMF